MTLPISPASISLNQVNVELGLTATAPVSLNDAVVRTLAGVVGSGTTISMSNLYGKSNRQVLSVVYSANSANPSLALGSISGYVAGVSDITVTVNTGVYIYSTSTATAALRITGGSTGDTLKLVCNGFIMGRGGNGGGRYAVDVNTLATSNPTAGGQAINSSWKFDQISGSGYIGGGGGGGGITAIAPISIATLSSGGGAGGGLGGTHVTGVGGTYQTLAGAPGGGLGGSGTNGVTAANQTYGQGGGGGRIMPGAGSAAATRVLENEVGGATYLYYGAGGQAGGGGGGIFYSSLYGTGGGGGWGAAGGTGYVVAAGNATYPGLGGGAGNVGGNCGTNGATPSQTFAGASGGAAIQTNGQGIGTVSCTVYGAIV